MTVETMSEEQYLRARGWKIVGQVAGRDEGDFMEVVPIPEAVEAQLAEDRALAAFVRERSARPSPAPAPPDDSLWFEDRDDVPHLYIGDRGEWYAFRMTPEKARAWAAVLTDFAEGRPVPARPAGEERSPWMPEFYERKGSSR